jgi:diketogulonate reductase-like aldo/keto reductase
MKTVQLPDGRSLPALGLGTWRMGEVARARNDEVAAVRRALQIGYRVIDTAEMYGEGGAERVVGQALAEAVRAGDVRREDVFVVSKVYPHNASRSGTLAACDRSRQRLQLETIDLYLLHWRGDVPLPETVAAFETLRDRKAIGRWGVSNFDVDDLAELWQVDGGAGCATNQIYYSLTERGPDVELLPWQQRHHLPTMAYSPIDQGALSRSPKLATIAKRRGVSPAQLALAWVLSRPNVMAIPKAVREPHLRENFDAAALALTDPELGELDRLFPPPARKPPLAML